MCGSPAREEEACIYDTSSIALLKLSIVGQGSLVEKVLFEPSL